MHPIKDPYFYGLNYSDRMILEVLKSYQDESLKGCKLNPSGKLKDPSCYNWKSYNNTSNSSSAKRVIRVQGSHG